MARAGKRVFFSADDGVAGQELWKTDGTRAGTKRVKNIYPGARASGPEDLAPVGRRVVFGAFEPTADTSPGSPTAPTPERSA